MNKKKTGRKFHRKTDQRRAFLKTLASSLVLKEKMKTTEARAKEVSSFLEKKITNAKKGGLSAQKLLLKTFSKQVTDKLLKELAPRFKERKGGYSRIIKLGKKQSDSSEMVQIELLK
jgi:large subunit ribosomal protein L17